MKIIHSFPHPVRVIENVWIPLSDGCRLAARIWLPETAGHRPVPAIFEYIPYRKRDFTRNRDEPMHYYYAGHGYAAIRADLRGSGDSDGVLLDEYLPQEQIDACEAIAWIAAQPWCDGNVGMVGISWGGFNALQVAACRPPALKAIITLCSTDDRYADDAHYMGGCLLNENLQWGSILLTFNAFPPDPVLVGDRWREMWRERLHNAVPFPALWMRHARRDDYWKQGSVCEDFSRIACPVYAIGGWADGYSNAVPRLLAGLSTPRKGLIGPWAHAFPHDAVPGPAIGYLQETLRWWDHWLKRQSSDIMDEPQLRVWLQDYIEPQPSYAERPGRWIAETQWPSPRLREKTLYLSASMGLLEQRSDDATDLALEFCSPQTTGLNGGDWCGFGGNGEAASDQREDDGKSLVFDSTVLEQAVDILGAPQVELDLAVDQPVALLAVRLNDIAADGASLRVSYGLLNLSHRDSHDKPEPLRPGHRYRIRIRLNDCAHRFAPGHCLRLALSTSYWPIAWPSPRPVRLQLYPAGCRLTLPLRPAHEQDEQLAAFAEPECAPTLEHTALRPARFQRTIERDLHSNETIYTVASDGGDYEGAALARVPDIDLDVGHTIIRRYIINETDPLSARAEIVQKALLRRSGWQIRVESRARLSATAEAFLLVADLDAYENDEHFFSRHWEETIARDLC
jgi:putative CocE/NonD family hydrolase